MAITGGRDGSIFKSHIVQNKYNKLYQGESKLMITSVKYDEVNNMIWFGTPDSSI